MDIVRRPATAADTEFGRSVHHQAYRDVVERQFGQWDENVQDRFFNVEWTSAAHEIILCDGAPVGYTSIEHRHADVHVRELVILPAFQGRGVGSHILEEVMAHARAGGVPVHLGTLHLNRAAELYRRMGFREVGRTDTHILFEWSAAAC